MCAAACAAKLDLARYEINLIESEQIGTVGVGEATLPQMRSFNTELGINEAEFMRATNATFKLGIEFVDWGRVGTSYIHPFSRFGRPIAGADFFQYWLRSNRDPATLFDLCLPIVAAKMNRFDFPVDDPTDPMHSVGYAYHLDASQYARYLRGWCEARGVRRIEGMIVRVDRDTERGHVRAVALESGDEIGGDLFIDCSGFRGLLIGDTLGVGVEDWSKWLPCDRAVAAPCASASVLTPYTRSTAREAGWQWRIPLQHRTGNGYVYASTWLDDTAAADALLDSLDGEPLGDPRTLRFKAFKRRSSWSSNVVAIGLAGGFLEPLESTSIYLVQMAILFLLSLLPDETGIDPALVREFNRVMDLEYDRIRDFLILHYCATEREDAELWRYCRAMQVPDSLKERIEQFRHRGFIHEYRDGLFGPPSWQAVFIGQGVLPRGHDAMADALSDAALAQDLDDISGTYQRVARQMPRHADLVAKYCSAADAS